MIHFQKGDKFLQSNHVGLKHGESIENNNKFINDSSERE